MKLDFVFVLAAALALPMTFLSSSASAQFDWQGSFSTDWGDAGNWQINGTRGPAAPGNPPTAIDNVNIFTTTGSPVISSGANFAAFLNVGATSVVDPLITGPGALDIIGGDLTISNDFEIGADAGGTVLIDGTNAPITIFVDDDINVDRNGDVTNNSSLTIRGDVDILVDDRVEIGSGSSSVVTVNIEGGVFRAEGDLRVRGGAGTVLNVTGGLVESENQFDVDTLAAISNDAIVRVERFSNDADGLITINDDAEFQIEADRVTGFELLNLINSPLFSTSTILPSGNLGQLKRELITVPDFFGDLNASFYRVSVVPEPATGALTLGMLSISLLLRRRSNK